MPKNSLIFLDLDGTLRNSIRRISTKNKEAIQKTLNNKDRIIITSGREVMYLKPIVESLGIKDYFIASDGAIIHDLKKDEVIKELFIKEKDLIFILKNIKECNYTATNSQKYYHKININSCKIPKISKITVTSTNKETILNLIKLIESRNSVHVSNYSRYLVDKKNKSKYYYFDVISADASKGYGAKLIQKLLKYPKEQTIALGDSINDISLFNSVGYKVAMGNAIPQLKQISDYITLSNNENGVYAYLDKRLKGDKL